MLSYISKYSPNMSDDSAVKLIINFAINMLWFRSIRNLEYINSEINAEFIDDYIINKNLLNELESFFRSNQIDFHLVETQTINRKIICVKYKNGLAPLVDVASTGTMSLYLFFYWMHKVDKLSFLFIDEFDAFYNNGLSLDIINYLNSKPEFQCIVTIHNSYLVGNDIKRLDCYFMLKANKIKSFADSINRVIRQAHNLEKMMLGNEFE